MIQTTRRLRVSLRLLGVALLVLLCAGSAFAFPRPQVYGQIANPHAEGTVIFWDEFQLNYDKLTVRVTGPCGDFSIKFDREETPFFDIRDLEGDPDGLYTWEIIADPTIDPGVAKLLKEVRGTSEEQEVVQSLWDDGKLPQGPFRQSGTFEVSRGLILDDGEVEKTNPQLTTGTGLEARKPGSVDSATEASEDGGLRNTLAEVVLTNANGVIRNSLCVGFDCPDNPTFSDTTILLMENNTRIKFDDTSVAASFPRNDWELEANSNLNGGGDWFAINDCGQSSQGGCVNDPVFIVEGGAPSNSIRVDSGGRVGLKNANPSLELHISDGDTPAVRLDQTGASGFAPHIWDLAGNETSFFVRDVSSGSTLPFRIFPGASSSSLAITSDNDILIAGDNSSTADASLHVRRSDGSAQILVQETNATTSNRVLLELRNNGGTQMQFENTATTTVWNFSNASGGVFRMNDPGSANIELELQPDGDLIIEGEITTSGSCSIGCDRVFSDDYELETIEEHAAAMWANSHLPGVGPTPEDGPFNLTKKTGGMLNELEKAHIYIEQLHKSIEELRARLDSIEQDPQDTALDR